MEIILSNPVEVVTRPEEKKTVSTLTVVQCVDSSATKKITAVTKELGQIVLWEGEEYDAIGQWTDTDVQNRIIELYDQDN